MNKMTKIQKTKVLDVELQFALEEDVWFNATQMVKNFNEKYKENKRLDKFWGLSETKAYVAELEEEMGSPDLGEPVFSGVKQVINSFDDKNGTYVHPELGILLARYLSPKFARACDKFIKDQVINAKAKKPELPDFSDPIVAARAWADPKENEVKAILEVNRKNKLLEKKDEVILAVADLNIKSGDVTVGDLGKNLAIKGIGQNNLFKWLKDRGFLMLNMVQTKDLITSEIHLRPKNI